MSGKDGHLLILLWRTPPDPPMIATAREHKPWASGHKKGGEGLQRGD